MKWRPIQPGECVREYHRAVELPVKYAGMVEYVVSLPDNAARGAFLTELQKRQGHDFASQLRRDAWARLKA